MPEEFVLLLTTMSESNTGNNDNSTHLTTTTHTGSMRSFYSRLQSSVIQVTTTVQHTSQQKLIQVALSVWIDCVLCFQQSPLYTSNVSMQLSSRLLVGIFSILSSHAVEFLDFSQSFCRHVGAFLHVQFRDSFPAD